MLAHVSQQTLNANTFETFKADHLIEPSTFSTYSIASSLQYSMILPS